MQQRAEIEEVQQRLRSVKEELAEKEGHLKVANMDLQTAKKQNQHQLQEVVILILFCFY